MINLTSDEIPIAMRKWQTKPKKFLIEALGITKIWRLQTEMLEALPRAMAERKEIYVASGHALGKDFISASIAQWFLYSFPSSIVVLTGPSARQVNNIMWKEITAQFQNRAINLGGRIFSEPRIEIAKDWFLVGFTVKETGATKEGGGGKFQGLHSSYVCVIVTEAQSIEDEIYDQIDAITTSQNVLVIFIGNPTRAKGRFAAGLKNRVRNIVFHFSCLENPNYLERRTVIPGLCSYEWVEKMREKWGEDDPRWISRVLGKVPDISINSIFPADLIETMKARHGFLANHSDIRGVSVDPAGEGMDENVFMAGSGGEILEKFKQLSMSPSDSAMQAVRMCRKIKGSFIVVDCDGIGIGVYQELQKFPADFTQNIFIKKFHGSAASTLTEGGKRIYANVRSEAAWAARDRAKRGHAAANPLDTELIEELEADEYFENKRGEIQCLPKEEIKERLDGRSPGSADCWKMLQWASEQEFETSAYEDETGERPEYADGDESQRSSIYVRPDPHQPRYGNTK